MGNNTKESTGNVRQCPLFWLAKQGGLCCCVKDLCAWWSDDAAMCSVTLLAAAESRVANSSNFI
jgi:hypothetical protein